MRSVLRTATLGRFVASEVEYVPGTMLARHAHATARFALVVSGQFREECAGATLACDPGTVTFRPAGAVHENRFVERTRCLTVECPGDLFASFPARQRALHHGGAPAIAEQIRREMAVADTASELVINGLLLQLAGLLLRGADDRSAPEWLLRVREHLQRTAAERQTLRELGARFGVHPTYLATLFRQRFGCTVGAFLRQRRVEIAAQLLRSTDRSLARIALDCGFADQSHFARVFRMGTGCSPSAFRRQERETKTSIAS